MGMLQDFHTRYSERFNIMNLVTRAGPVDHSAFRHLPKSKPQWSALKLSLYGNAQIKKTLKPKIMARVITTSGGYLVLNIPELKVMARFQFDTREPNWNNAFKTKEGSQTMVIYFESGKVQHLYYLDKSTGLAFGN